MPSQKNTDGAIERINNSGKVSATGTWLLEGDQFSAIYTFKTGSTIVILEGTVDKTQKKFFPFNLRLKAGCFYNEEQPFL